jgi:hypothetical protein
MRRLSIRLAVIGLLLVALPGQAATGRIFKMLPFYLDVQGRHELSPSLYERDAYQDYLRQNQEKCSAMLFDVQWKVKGEAQAPLKLKLQLRGSSRGSSAKEMVLEQVVERGGRFSHWTGLKLEGQQYKDFGGITAWRATLWEGDQLLSEQKSFLW